MLFAKCDGLCRDLEYLQEPEEPHCFRSRAASRTLPDAPRVHLDVQSQILPYCLEDFDTEVESLGEKFW